MYRTQSVILNRKKQSVICSYFDEWSLTSKAIYNSALFIERQLVSSSGKSEGMYSENEKEVRSLTREMIPRTQMTVGYAKLEKSFVSTNLNFTKEISLTRVFSIV